MSNSAASVPERSNDDGAVSVHTLRPDPPVRAFGIAAVTSVVGAGVLVLASAQGWPTVVQVLGVVILVAGLALLVTALWSMVRMRVRAELTKTGYTFRTPMGVRHGTWAETTSVTASESGRRMSIHHRDETVQHVLAPVGATDPNMQALVKDMADRLKSSRS